jgi:hypothetical protein
MSLAITSLGLDLVLALRAPSSALPAFAAGVLEQAL